jgi:O-antigen/teichoic acid export membrane protein/GT2 family glycosyltransferase
MKSNFLKIGFVFVLYQTPKKEIERLKKEIESLRLKNYQIYLIENSVNNRGYAGAINEGLKKGLKDEVDVFIIANTDISFKKLINKNFLEGLNQFDILGLSMQQGGKIYYGGTIDQWRLSGGLNENKQKKRFFAVDFVSGSLMIIKKKVIEKVGFLDERYFMYYEDVDYCFRAKKAGFRVGIDSQLNYDHFEISKNNPKKDYFLFKNRWRFFLRFSNWKQKLRELIRLPLTFFQSVSLFWRLFLQSSFLRDFFSLNFSTVLNKIFHFLLFIFLVKHLSPEDYGIYTLVWAFLGFFNPFLDLGTTNYGLVFLSEQKKEDANKLISLRFFTGIAVFLLINLVAFFSFKEKPVIILYVFFVSLSTLSNVWSGTYLILNAISQKVIHSSLVSLIFNFYFVLSIVIFYLFGRNLQAIFSSVFISFLVYTIVNFYLVKERIKILRFDIDWSFWFKIIKRSYLFVLISFFAGLRFRTDAFLLNHFYGEGSVGIYSSGYKFYDALVLIIGSYNIIVVPILKRMINDKNALLKKIKKDFILLSIISVGLVIGFVILAPIVLPFILSGKYQNGIALARIIIFALIPVFIASIFYNLFYAMEKIASVLKIYMVQTVIGFVLNIIFIPKYGVYAPALITVFVESLGLLMSLLIFRYYLKPNTIRREYTNFY